MALALLPFVAAAVAMRWAVGPVGDRVAGSMVGVVGSEGGRERGGERERERERERGGERGREGESDGELGREGSVGPRRVASVRAGGARRAAVEEARDGGTDGGKGASADDAPKGTILVPAAVVARAIEKRNVGATNANAADGTPLGARLVGVSRYGVGLRDGDVVVFVGATRTRNVEALVAAGMAAASSGASRISGRILRGDAVYAVVLELPKPPP